MKIGQALLFPIVAVLISITAWAFWQHLGPDADAMLAAIMIVGLLLDNLRLRRMMHDRDERS